MPEKPKPDFYEYCRRFAAFGQAVKEANAKLGAMKAKLEAEEEKRSAAYQRGFRDGQRTLDAASQSDGGR